MNYNYVIKSFLIIWTVNLTGKTCNKRPLKVKMCLPENREKVIDPAALMC